ncbi:5-formyltetrahydrofolate cyclo-ligase [Candidatus Desulfarcum epimagneticum]|uniref:5-formyltetrahydrofolate cyclo-ligase n=1 Tax=uncultured Desulfobacteraceae bacterium TaxID=218296 RepID=A0A484HER3_9BACT|nr:5-formyltetrahydrofolate cyclo-ligase [uncultured Desulfobacteraceae bacterium]
MEDSKETKDEIRSRMFKKMEAIPESKKTELTRMVRRRLFDFANFIESKIAMLYVNKPFEVPSREIIKKALSQGKIIVLPDFGQPSRPIKLFKIDAPGEAPPAAAGEDDSEGSRAVPIECLDIVIVPGLAFDEKGGRMGSGNGHYDRVMPHLPITARKVALAFEEQVIPQVNMESHDKYVDIIITEKRTIYKI